MYLSTVPVHFTCPLYCPCLLYLSTVPDHYTCRLYLSAVLVDCTCPLYVDPGPGACTSTPDHSSGVVLLASWRLGFTVFLWLATIAAIILILRYSLDILDNHQESASLYIQCYHLTLLLSIAYFYAQHSPNLPYSKGIGSLEAAIPDLKVVQR